MKIKYVVYLDNKYMNSFYEYSKAVELRDRLLYSFKGHNVRIEQEYEK